jgi:hypothetical protein
MHGCEVRASHNQITKVLLPVCILFVQLILLMNAYAETPTQQDLASIVPIMPGSFKSGNDQSYWNSLPPTLDPRTDDKPAVAMQSPLSAPLNGYIEDEDNSSASSDAPIIIDNDEAKSVKTTIEYKELPTDEGKTHVKAGGQFPVIVMSEISSKTAKKGDTFQARLKYDLKIGDRIVAEKGSIVNAHINYSLKSRCILHSMMSVERWYRNSGCLGITFDEIINGQGDHIPLVATPAQRSLIVRNKAEGRLLGVNHNGQITGPWSQQIRYEALRVGINAALSPAGVFSFGALPATLGVIGAVNPSFAFMKPVGQNVRHRRIKGFAFGFIDGLPGGFLVQDTVIKGQEAVIKPGDEFLCEFQEEFTGEPATEAELMPNAMTKVHGEVVPRKKKGKQT